MAEHAVDNSSARYRSKRQAARTVSSGNVDMLSLKATEDRQSVNAHWPNPDPNLRERGTCQPGRNSQRFVQLLAYPAGRHPVIEAAAILPGRADDNPVRRKCQQVVVMESVDDRPGICLHIRHREMQDLPTLRRDRHIEPHGCRELAGPGTGRKQEAVAGERLPVHGQLAVVRSVPVDSRPTLDFDNASTDRGVAQRITEQAPVHARALGHEERARYFRESGKLVPRFPARKFRNFTDALYTINPATLRKCPNL